MAHANRRPGSDAPLSRPQSRLLLVVFFAVTIVLAFLAARAIVTDMQDPALQQQIETMRERKNQNSLFPPQADTLRPPVTAPDSTTRP